MPVNGPALGALAFGSVFLYSAIKGKSVLASAQAVIQGKSPTTVKTSSPINEITPAQSAGVTGIGIGTSGLPSAGTYNHATAMQLWIKEGGPASTANNAACHAMQESSGNPQAHSANPDGGENIGLYQLDTKGVGAGYPISALENAATNTRITIMATNGGRNWSQWATPGC